MAKQKDFKQKSITPYSLDKLKISPELESVQDLMPIEPRDYEQLKKDIEESGEIRDPIKVYINKKGERLIIGGLNRVKVARELGWDKVPIEIVGISGPQKIKELAIKDNLSRRQLRPSQETILLAELYPEYFKGGDTVSTPTKKEISKETGLHEKKIQRAKSVYSNAKEKAEKKGKKEPDIEEIKEVQEEKNAERKEKSAPPKRKTKDEAPPNKTKGAEFSTIKDSILDFLDEFKPKKRTAVIEELKKFVKGL